MANIILSHVNQVDRAGASLTASAWPGDLTIDNVRDTRRGKRWRATGPAAWGQVDFGVNVPISVLALSYPLDVPLPAGTVRHRLDPQGGTQGTGATYDSGAVDIGAVDGYGYHIHILPVPVEARYWRFSYGLTSPFADTGRAWAGEHWQPEVNYAYGAGDAFNDLSVVTQNRRSGAEFVDRRLKQRAFSFSLDYQDEEARGTIREMKRIVGISRQVLCVRDPDHAAREAIIGRLTEVSAVLDAGLDIFSSAFAIRETL